MQTKVFKAQLSQLPQMLQWIGACLEEAHFEEGDRKKIEIALEEVFVNIISYAYIDSAGTIEIIAEWNADFIEFTLKDRGVAFNPLLYEANVDPDIPIEERQLGGLGIVLVKELMDDLDYRRDNQYNIFTLRKHR